MNFQHEKTYKIIKNHDFNAKNHDFERKIFWVAHFFVILRCQVRSPKNGVYKKRSNPNKETKHSWCDNPKSKTRLTGRK